MFYHYHQNNSGGSFTFDEAAGISCNVIIEADTPGEADEIANTKGLYFNGVANDRDCECCGDRWSPTYDKGSAEPELYGEPIALMQDETGTFNRKWMKGGKPEGYVHFKDGTILPFGF